MADRFVVVPAGYLVLMRGDEVLLQLRQNTGYRDGYWACGAAGHVEQGESSASATSREATEELGIIVAEADLEPLCTLHRTAEIPEELGTYEDERVDFFFLARHWTGTPGIQEPRKCADLQWFPLDRLPDPVVPHELTVLSALEVRRREGTPVPPIMHLGFS